jgi:hypothetical protein
MNAPCCTSVAHAEPKCTPCRSLWFARAAASRHTLTVTCREALKVRPKGPHPHVTTGPGLGCARRVRRVREGLPGGLSCGAGHMRAGVPGCWGRAGGAELFPYIEWRCVSSGPAVSSTGDRTAFPPSPKHKMSIPQRNTRPQVRSSTVVDSAFNHAARASGVSEVDEIQTAIEAERRAGQRALALAGSSPGTSIHRRDACRGAGSTCPRAHLPNERERKEQNVKEEGLLIDCSSRSLEGSGCSCAVADHR